MDKSAYILYQILAPILLRSCMQKSHLHCQQSCHEWTQNWLGSLGNQSKQNTVKLWNLSQPQKFGHLNWSFRMSLFCLEILTIWFSEQYNINKASHVAHLIHSDQNNRCWFYTFQWAIFTKILQFYRFCSSYTHNIQIEIREGNGTGWDICWGVGKHD